MIKERIEYSGAFDKQLKRASLNIKIAFRARLKLFLHDPLHSQLRNHKLVGKYKNYRSINITGDWRALFIENKVNNNIVVTFVLLGTHNQLYK